MWVEYGHSYAAERDAVQMFCLIWGTRGWARQETQAEMTLLSPSLLAWELCPYSPRMSRVAPLTVPSPFPPQLFPPPPFPPTPLHPTPFSFRFQPPNLALKPLSFPFPTRFLGLFFFRYCC